MSNLMAIFMLSIGFVACEEEPKAPQTPESIDIFAELEKDEMIYVKGGTFTMGATSEQGTDEPYDNEYPTHQVTLSDFYIGKYEVTQQLWEYVMGTTPKYIPGNYLIPATGDYLPVECVSWEDCQEFISKLNQMTGKAFRMPTEAEWEYAARGGNKSNGYKYSGSNSIGDVAWYYGNSSNNGNSSNSHEVGTKAPNELGLYDMSGNVYEWCSDWFATYSSSSQTNPTGPSSGSYRVLRGGNWECSAPICRVSSRNYNVPGSGYFYCGFRLACDL